MEKLIEVIQKVIYFFLYPLPEDRSRHVELRRVYQELRYLKLSYTDALGRHIHPDFAAKVYELWVLIESLDKLLNLPHQRGELFQSDDLLEYLLVRQLDESFRERLDGINPGNLLSRIQNSPDGELALQQIESEWKDITHFISELHDTALHQNLFQLEILYALTEYDFKKLLSKFDPMFERKKKSSTPRFRECGRESAEQDLLDLYYIMGGLKLDHGARKLIQQTAVYYSGEKDHEKDHEKDRVPDLQKQNEILDHIGLLLENDLSEATFGALLKLLHQDPAFSQECMKRERDYIDDVWQFVHRRYQNSIIFVQREQLDARNTEKLTDFFPEELVEQVPFYNREADNLFSAVGLHGFLYGMPLSIIKTYQRHILAGEPLAMLMKFNYDGIFNDMGFKNSFQTIVEKAGEIGDYIVNFEKNISVAEMFDETGSVSGPASKAAELEKYRDELDGEAQRIIELTKEVLDTLNHHIMILMEDYRMLHPRIITNIKIIGGSRNRDMFKTIENLQELHSAVSDALDSYL